MDWTEAPFVALKAFGYTIPRFLGVFTILPLFGRETLPMTLRMGVMSALALLLLPAMFEGAERERTNVEMALLVLREAFFGALIGLVLAVPLWAVEAMGDIIDTQRGANMAQSLNPLTGNDTSPLGQLFNQAIVTFLFVVGGFSLVLGVVYESFVLWPVFGRWPGFGPEAATVLLSLADKLMRLMLLLAAPVVFSMFLAEAGLALVSRFVPQLQVFFLAMPVKSGIAFTIFAVYAVILFDTAYGMLVETISNSIATLGAILRPVR